MKELTSHEEVVREDARHSKGLTAPVEDDTSNVDDGTEQEANDHGDRHEVAKVVDNLDQIEQAGHVQSSRRGEGNVPAGEG
jgi:hypothetical protein